MRLYPPRVSCSLFVLVSGTLLRTDSGHRLLPRPPAGSPRTSWCSQCSTGERARAQPPLTSPAPPPVACQRLTILTFPLLPRSRSLAGLGIAIVNDFKSIEGDRKMGLQSLPVAFGVDAAKWICVSTIDVTQLAVAAYLYSIGEETYAYVLLGLILPQMALQYKFLIPDPIANDVKYQASAQPFLVFGLLTTGLAWGHHTHAVLDII